MAWEHALEAPDHLARATLIALRDTDPLDPASNAMIAAGLAAASDAASFGLTLGAERGALRFELSYDGVVSERHESHSASAILSLAF